MKATNSVVLNVMNVLFWVVFIGLCIKTGALLTAFLVSLFISAEGAKDLYTGLNLAGLHAYSLRHYVQVVSLLLMSNALKAYMAYLVVRIFMKFDLASPFHADVTDLITAISQVAFGAGLVAVIANGYTDWLLKRGVAVPLHWNSSELLFFAGVIYIIAHVFKRGTELQTDNELTV